VSDEPPLWNPGEDHEGLARRDHQATAKLAATLVMPYSGTQRKRVLNAVWRAGIAGATRDEIAERLGMSPNTVRPRVVELVEHGWIEPDGRTRPTALGRLAEVLVLTERGRADIRRRIRMGDEPT